MFENPEATWRTYQLNREDRLNRALFHASLQWGNHPGVIAPKGQWQKFQEGISEFVHTLRCRFLAHCPPQVELAPCCQEVRS